MIHVSIDLEPGAAFAGCDADDWRDYFLRILAEKATAWDGPDFQVRFVHVVQADELFSEPL